LNTLLIVSPLWGTILFKVGYCSWSVALPATYPCKV
jgi:hypothetical protein